LKFDVELSSQAALDEENVRKAKGDPAAFRLLYEKYYKPIFVFILHRTSDKMLSADITSQVFLKALVALDKYEFRGLPFSSWLYRIAVNECNSFFRKKKYARTVVLEDKHADHVYEEMFGESNAEELRQKLPLILQRLKPSELELIELRFLDGRPFKEVGEILDMSETHVKTKTYRTLDKMKKLFLRK
jgi:RNA polymerase sigma-70 factor (ECF subfamily)